MGMFDYLTCKTRLPGFENYQDVDCQTKSLFCTLAKFTITFDGRLIQHRTRIENAEATEAVFGEVVLPRRRDIPLGDRDLEFHGDLQFITTIPGMPFVNFVARFTNGQLSWIKSTDELSELAQDILSCRCM